MAEYRLSPAAERDLESIWQYTFTQWGVEQAHRYTDALIIALGTLADSPQTALTCDHIRIGYRARIIERHIIYFRVTTYGIAVIRILHQRMDAIRHL